MLSSAHAHSWTLSLPGLLLSEISRTKWSRLRILLQSFPYHVRTLSLCLAGILYHWTSWEPAVVLLVLYSFLWLNNKDAYVPHFVYSLSADRHLSFPFFNWKVAEGVCVQVLCGSIFKYETVYFYVFQLMRIIDDIKLYIFKVIWYTLQSDSKIKIRWHMDKCFITWVCEEWSCWSYYSNSDLIIEQLWRLFLMSGCSFYMSIVVCGGSSTTSLTNSC